MSENKNELYEALAKAQLEVKNPPKDKTANARGSFSYRYTDLATMIDSNKPILAKYGLTIISKTGFIDGRFCCITKLVHTSGQFEESVWPIQEGPPQAMGSACSYARRYTRQGLTDVAGEEDDDGAHATESEVAGTKNVSQVRTTAITQPSDQDPSLFFGLSIKEAWEKQRAKSVMKCFEIQKSQRAGQKVLPKEKAFFEYGVVNKLFSQEPADA